MNVSAYSDVMQIVALVFLLGTAVLLARRAYSAWRGGTVFAVLIVTTTLLFTIQRVVHLVHLPASSAETVLAGTSGPTVSEAAPRTEQPSPAPLRRQIAKARPATIPETLPPSAVAEAPTPLAPRHATVLAGTTLIVRTQQTLSTVRNLKGDTFSATLEQPLVADGYVIAEKGAIVDGVVERSQRAGRVEGVAGLAITLVRLETSGGQKLPISTNLHEVQGERSRGSDAKKVGAAAAIGATIGAIVGGGKGAAIGAGLGAGAGGGAVVATRGKDAVIPSESVVVFYLKAPLGDEAKGLTAAAAGSNNAIPPAGVARAEDAPIGVSAVIDRVLDGVVALETDASRGTGFFASNDCQVLTNAHVVAGAKEIVAKDRQQRLLTAEVIAANPDRDLALLRAKTAECRPLVVERFPSVKIADEVYAVGNPLGLTGTVTKGIVSSIRTVGDGIQLFQIDAALNPGNSGGPLVDRQGRVVGINTFKWQGVGLNFAVSTSEVFRAFGTALGERKGNQSYANAVPPRPRRDYAANNEDDLEVAGVSPGITPPMTPGPGTGLRTQSGGQAPVAVYVSAPMKDGFVDTNKDIQDSVKDVQHHLSGMREFRIVESREKADITVTVLMRGVGSQAYGQRLRYSEYSSGYYTNAELTNTPMVAQTLWVSAVMEIGTYRKEFTGTALNIPGARWGRWNECAGHLAKDVKSWVRANAEQIRAHRR